MRVGESGFDWIMIIHMKRCKLQELTVMPRECGHPVIADAGVYWIAAFAGRRRTAPLGSKNPAAAGAVRRSERIAEHADRESTDSFSGNSSIV